MPGFAWTAGGAVVGAVLAVLYLRRYERRGWRSTGHVLLVVLLLAVLVGQAAANGAQARAAAYGFTVGALAGAAVWGLRRLAARRDRQRTS